MLSVLGEFVVIVLGVLVALAVDARTDERAARERETQLLPSLAVDLRGSLEDLRNDKGGAVADMEGPELQEAISAQAVRVGHRTVFVLP